MAKKESNRYTPNTEAFKEKLLEAIKKENKGEAIKRVIDEFVAEVELNVLNFNKRDK